MQKPKREESMENEVGSKARARAHISVEKGFTGVGMKLLNVILLQMVITMY